MPGRSQRFLKERILTEIPSPADLPLPRESAAVEDNRADGAIELLFSASPRPAIQLEPQPTAPQRFRFQWCPVPISLSALTKLLDGLILLCAVLFFAVMALVMTNVLPTWPITILLAIGITAVFVTLYWFLFVFWIGSTPGEHLAQMACSESLNRTHGEQEEQPRFR